MDIGRQSKKVTRGSFDEHEVKVLAESVAKAEIVDDVTPTASGALQPKAGSGAQVSAVAMSQCCVVSDNFFNELEDMRELEKGSALHRNVNLVLADALCSTRGAMV